MQRSADFAGAALRIELFGDRERVWINFDHRIQLRPVAVDFSDAFEIRLNQTARGAPSVSLLRLELRDADFLEFVTLHRECGQHTSKIEP